MFENVAQMQFCDDCNKPLIKGRACKNCADSKKESHFGKSDFFCYVVINGIQCRSTHGLTRMNVGQDQEMPIFWCRKHYEGRRSKSDIDFEIDRRAKQYADRAKECGMTNKQFFDHHFGFDLKRAAEQLANKN